jgi:hypothetical protein
MRRPLSFSPEIESVLREYAYSEENLADLRAAYRHGVFANKLTPREAVMYALNLTASAGPLTIKPQPVPEEVELMNKEDYASPEHAIFSLSELSGMGHEIIPALRAAWKRGVDNPGIDPFYRAASLAINQYDSQDADLLPNKE